MACKLSDEDIRTKLLPYYKTMDAIPPIIEATRPYLLKKISEIEDQALNSHSCIAMSPVGNDIFTMATQRSPLKTLVFFDLEATGLPKNATPPRITELSFKALSIDHFSALEELYQNLNENIGMTSTPRVINSLELCFNPASTNIPPIVSQMTGFTNELLQDQPVFSSGTIELLSSFLQNLPQPVCLVAHNGNNYDFPLLKAELLNVGSDFPLEIFIVDSIEALKHIYKEAEKAENEQIVELVNNGVFDDEMLIDLEEKKDLVVQVPSPTTSHSDEDECKTPERDIELPKNPPPLNRRHQKSLQTQRLSQERRQNGAKVKKRLNFITPYSYSLPKLFEHIFGELPEASHGAACDVISLIKVCSTRSKDFISYVENHRSLFRNVKKMW